MRMVDGIFDIRMILEKLMAAERAGLKKILIPEENVRDLDEVPEEVRKKLEILPVKTIEEVLETVHLELAMP